MKRLLKVGCIGLLLAAMLAALCGCMTKENKAIAEANVRTGRGVVKNYVAENYGENAKIERIQCVNKKKDSGPIPDFYDYPSDYVQATVAVKKERFEVLVNVETGIGYDNRYQDSVEKTMQQYFSSRADLPEAYKTQIEYYPAGTEGLAEYSCIGFADPNTKLFEQLLYQGKSEIKVICQYVDEDLSTLKAEGEKLIPLDWDVGNVRIGFLNFRNSAAAEATFAEAESLLNQVHESVREVYIIDRRKQYDAEANTDVYPDELETTYHHYDLLSLNSGISLVYDTETLEVQVKEEESPEIVTALSKSFTTWDGKQYRATVQQKREQEEFDVENQSIHLFFSDKYKDLFLVSEQDGDEDWSQLNSSWDGVMTEWFAVHSGQSEITFGLYTEMD